MTTRIINVGIGEVKTCGPDCILKSILGSCVAVCVIDLHNQRAGLAHVVLPRYDGHNKIQAPARFADKGVEFLIKKMISGGSIKEDITAKLVGGASVLGMGSNTEFALIGKNNAEVSRTILKKYNIEIIYEEIGGDFGRTVTLFSNTGELKVTKLSMQMHLNWEKRQKWKV